MMLEIHELYETGKEKKHKDVAVAKHVALTGHYWTYVTSVTVSILVSLHI